MNLENTPWELLYVIVSNGLGSKALRLAKKCGMGGGTILLGIGSGSHNPILDLCALCDVRKEIVLMAGPRTTVQVVLETLNQELKLYKPNHGIAYSISLSGVCGSRNCVRMKIGELLGGEAAMYQSIMIIVDKGKGESVVDAASAAGSTGATIINARGSGIHETSKIFSMEIEPEKEIVLIIAANEKTETIVSSIRKNFEIDTPGNGIIFVQDISQAYGLVDTQ